MKKSHLSVALVMVLVAAGFSYGADLPASNGVGDAQKIYERHWGVSERPQAPEKSAQTPDPNNTKDKRADSGEAQKIYERHWGKAEPTHATARSAEPGPVTARGTPRKIAAGQE